MAQSEHLITDVKKAAQQAHRFNLIYVNVGRKEKEPRAGVRDEELTSERQKEKI